MAGIAIITATHTLSRVNLATGIFEALVNETRVVVPCFMPNGQMAAATPTGILVLDGATTEKMRPTINIANVVGIVGTRRAAWW